MSAGLLVGVYPTLSPAALLRPPPPPPPFPFAEPGLTLTHLGRGAVWLALRALGLGPGRRLAMPAYHCGSEVEAARLSGVEVVFYRVDASLGADEDDLARAAASSDATYLISCFGFPPPPAPAGARVVADMAHGLFSEGPSGPLGAGADAAVFCPRKSLGVPDGGALLVPPAAAAPAPADAPAPASAPMPAPRRAAWTAQLRSVASLVAGRAALSGHTSVRAAATAAISRASRADAAAREGRLTETVIGEWGLEVADLERAAGPPSPLTARLISRVDAPEVRRRRRRNYAALAEELAPSCPERFRRLPPGVCPLYFPMLAPDRREVIARLLSRGVRAIEVWPVPHPLLERARFAELDPVRRDLLALPVHQDLEPWHVEAVVRAAKEALSAGGAR